MRKVECLEVKAEKLDKQNETLEQCNESLQKRAFGLHEQAQEVLAKHDLRADTLKMISKEVVAETKNMRSAAVPVTNLFGCEEYVKVKKATGIKCLMLLARQYQEIISWKSMRKR